MTSPFGSFLEGAAGGFRFVQDVKARKRAEERQAALDALDAEERRRRMAAYDAEQAAAMVNRGETVEPSTGFTVTSTLPDRPMLPSYRAQAQRLREGVGSRLMGGGVRETPTVGTVTMPGVFGGVRKTQRTAAEDAELRNADLAVAIGGQLSGDTQYAGMSPQARTAVIAANPSGALERLPLIRNAETYRAEFPEIPAGLSPEETVRQGQRRTESALIEGRNPVSSGPPKQRQFYDSARQEYRWQEWDPQSQQWLDTGQMARAPAASETTREQVLAAARTMVEAGDTAEELERRNPEAAVMPVMAEGVRGIGNVPIIGGLTRGFTEAAAQGLMSSDQQRFRQAADAWTHNYVATLPRSRVSPQLIEQINRTFFPRAGQTDPAVLRQFREKRNRAGRALLAALEGRTADLSGLPGFEGLTAADLRSGQAGPGTPSQTPENPFADHPWSRQ